MRVLQLIPTLGGGGAERQVALLAHALTSFGVELHIGYQHPGPNSARLQTSGAVLHRIPFARNYDARLPPAVFRMVRRVKPDLVHTWLTSMDLLGGLAAAVSGVPWLLSERTDPQYYRDWSNYKTRLRRVLGRWAVGVTGNSAAGLTYWADVIPEEHRYLVPNAVPIEEIDAAQPLLRTQLPLPVDRPLVVYAGRFSPEKNTGTLAAAVARLVSEERAVAMLCGEGPDRPLIEAELSAQVRAGQVLVTGYHHELWRLLKAANALVLVSHFEGSPNVVLEAMACGCPVVVSNIPAHRALLDDDAAWFVNGSDVDSVVAGVASALTTGGASGRPQAARIRAEQHSPQEAARLLTRIYTEVVAPSRPLAARRLRTRALRNPASRQS